MFWRVSGREVNGVEARDTWGYDAILRKRR